MLDLYNYGNGSQTEQSLYAPNAQEIMKAMEATLSTGRDFNNQIHSIGGLKSESLDPLVKVLESKMTDNVLFNTMPKQRIYNTVHEYNQLYKYGQEVGIFNLEGETPQATDSQYRRKSIIAKFMGITGEVTHAATLAKTADGKNAMAREVENKTALLLRSINRKLSVADSSKIDSEFDGLFRQHLLGVNEIYSPIAGKTPEQLMDTYFADGASVIDARGSILTDDLVQDAADGIVNTRFGEISHIISNPTVFNDYAKQFQQYKQVLVGGVNGVENANMGQSVGSITTQFGKIGIENDKFFDKREPKLYNAAATGDMAPAAPTKDGSTPIAVNTDTKTKFTGEAGGYFYGVTAKNRFGESAMTMINTTIQAVAATESVDLKFAATAGNYAAEAFVIYRTEKDATPYTTAKLYPLFEVSAAELTAGWDGASAGLVRDRNRILPNTYRALVYYKSNDYMEYLQYCPTMRMDYAQTSPKLRFSVLNYGTPVSYQPGKMAIIWNIGKKTT
jgi:hypothetical protein